MDLFELLFIAIFILFPILEGVLRQRKKGRTPPPSPDRTGSSDEGADREASESAAEMLPDDLWELMTGERRSSEPEPAEEPGDTPWSVDPDSAPAATAEVDEPESEPWTVDDEATAPEPVSLEYEGPEAYSLETPAPEPLERRVPTAEARHRAFHELVDRPKRRKPRRLSPLMRSLRSSGGLRQAVLLKEILGPPKGLE